MSDHVVLGEVRTYYKRAGRGDPLVLLHPRRATPGARSRPSDDRARNLPPTHPQ